MDGSETPEIVLKFCHSAYINIFRNNLYEIQETLIQNKVKN